MRNVPLPPLVAPPPPSRPPTKILPDEPDHTPPPVTVTIPLEPSYVPMVASRSSKLTEAPSEIVREPTALGPMSKRSEEPVGGGDASHELMNPVTVTGPLAST